MPRLKRVVSIFPVAGLNGLNPGNLMLDAHGVCCIDNAFPQPQEIGNPEWRQTFTSRLDAVLSLTGGPSHPRAKSCLEHLVDFFPKQVTLSWDELKPDALAGFHDEVHVISELSEDAVSRQLAILEKQRSTAPLAPFLRDNLRRFKKIATPKTNALCRRAMGLAKPNRRMHFHAA